jgi:PhzF family phenazine biosynthesis protein
MEFDMTEYEISIVFAFSGEKAHGNPALVVFADNISDENKREITKQARVSINGESEVILPIIDFVKVNDLQKKIFDIEYWLPDRQVSICGHGTIAAVKAIVEKYNINDGKEYEYTFNLNVKDFKENAKFPQLKVKSDGKNFELKVDDIVYPSPLPKTDPAYKLIDEELKGNLVDGILYFTDLHDYVCVCKDAKALRELVISKEKLIELKNIKKEERNYRIFIAVAPTDIENYDYETTVFSDELPPPVYKDPACGSANKEVPQLLKLSGLFADKFKDKDGAKFKMFYPYRFADATAKNKGWKGGIQEVLYKDGKIFVKSNTSDGKRGIATCNEGGKIDFLFDK